MMPASFKKPYKHFARFRTAFYGVMMALLCMIFAMPMSAAKADLFTVDNVEVDVTAKNALAAREKAFEEAQMKAYQVLVERLLSDTDSSVEIYAPQDMNQGMSQEISYSADKEATIDTVSFMVQDYEVTKEQLSATRYKGTYMIRFNPAAFKKKAAEQGLSFTDMRRGQVLVLPYFQQGSSTYIWDGANPFLNAWARLQSTGQSSQSDGTGAVIPIGDMDDVRFIDEYAPLSYDPNNIEAVKRRYGAQEVIIAIAAVEESASGERSLRVSTYNALMRGPEFNSQFNLIPESGEPLNTLFSRAVARVNDNLDSEWKTQTAEPLTAGAMSTTRAAIQFNSVREWINLKQSIERAAGVSAVAVSGLTPRQAIVTITHQGDIERLRLGLDRLGLTVGNMIDARSQLYPIYQKRQAGASIPGTPPRTPISVAPAYVTPSYPSNGGVYASPYGR